MQRPKEREGEVRNFTIQERVEAWITVLGLFLIALIVIAGWMWK